MEVGIGPDGTIVEVGRSVPGGERHDVGDSVILPAATDLHVHFREPGPSSRIEGFAAGTLQAALGGVGLIGEMPNTDPPVTDPDRWVAKAGLARGRLAVDAFLYGAATIPAEIRKLGRVAAAFKLYLSPTTGIPAPRRALRLDRSSRRWRPRA